MINLNPSPGSVQRLLGAVLDEGSFFQYRTARNLQRHLGRWLPLHDAEVREELAEAYDQALAKRAAEHETAILRERARVRELILEQIEEKLVEFASDPATTKQWKRYAITKAILADVFVQVGLKVEFDELMGYHAQQMAMAGVTLDDPAVQE